MADYLILPLHDNLVPAISTSSAKWLSKPGWSKLNPVCARLRRSTAVGCAVPTVSSVQNTLLLSGRGCRSACVTTSQTVPLAHRVHDIPC